MPKMTKELINEKLQRMVLDENKIVTYKTLSRATEVHPNKAKKYLNEFFESNRMKENLGAFYFISGTKTHENNIQGMKASIVEEKDLENAKSALITITSCHIYSIHKGTLVDKCALYTTDYCPGDDKRQLTVVNPHVRIEQKQRLIHNANNASSNVKKPTIANPISEKKPIVANPVFEKKPEVKTKSPVKSTSPIKSKAPNIFNMFQKQVATKVSDSTNKNISSGDGKKTSPTLKNGAQAQSKKKETTTKTTKSPVTKADVKSMFSKQAEKNALKPSIKQELESDDDFETKSLKSSPPKASKKISKSSQNGSKTSQSVSKSSMKSTSTSKKNKKKLKESSDSDSECKQKRKHRRIATLDDSDSPSENEEEKDKAQRNFFGIEPQETASPMIMNDDDDDDIIPPTPVEKGKRRVQKTVTKTFQDDDGFMVTKTSKEYVTESEGSDVEETKKAKPVVLKKKSPIVNTKQASLTSFFKQK